MSQLKEKAHERSSNNDTELCKLKGDKTLYRPKTTYVLTFLGEATVNERIKQRDDEPRTNSNTTPLSQLKERAHEMSSNNDTELSSQQSDSTLSEPLLADLSAYKLKGNKTLYRPKTYAKIHSSLETSTFQSGVLRTASASSKARLLIDCYHYPTSNCQLQIERAFQPMTRSGLVFSTTEVPRVNTISTNEVSTVNTIIGDTARRDSIWQWQTPSLRTLPLDSTRSLNVDDLMNACADCRSYLEIEVDEVDSIDDGAKRCFSSWYRHSPIVSNTSKYEREEMFRAASQVDRIDSGIYYEDIGMRRPRFDAISTKSRTAKRKAKNSDLNVSSIKLS